MLELPPAPADLVLAGLALATLSCLSAAARLRIMVLGPPGGLGDDGRAPLVVPELPLPAGLEAGEDWSLPC